ncbi:MAG TPA: ABC transporter permease [Thermoanaerobaculia bacterium]|jgi:predicted permease|nr:ABC transporter permease [Thermoanaerobaculia bacterium]
MSTLLQDLRYALRTLAKSPGFTAVILLTLGLGIGADVAIFSVARGVLFEPLPYRDPSRLYRIGHAAKDTHTVGSSFSPQDFDDLVEAHPGLESAAAWSYSPNLSGVNVTGAGEPERIPAAMVSGSFFDTIGMPVRAGRALSPADDHAGANHVAVVSSALWQRHFGSDPTAIGRTLQLDGVPFTIVGVLPPAFDLPAPEVELWLPLSTVGEDSVPHRREVRWLDVVGRLRKDAAPESARAGLDALFVRLAARFPDSNAGFDHARIIPLQASLTGDSRGPILVLLGAVSLVLLIACVNVANLLLARAIARRREVAVRSALGASRGRIVRQLLVESLVLAISGGAIGLLIARWGIDGLAALATGRLARAGEIRMDSGVLAFALLLSVTTGLVFGLLPALQASGGNLRAAIELAGGRSGTESRGAARLRRALVLGETALAVVLLFGAGLLIRSFWRLTHVDTGMRTASVLTLSLSIPKDIYDAERDGAYRDAILSRIRALPGVLAAGGSKTLPLQGGGEAYGVHLEGRPEGPPIQPEGGTIIVTTGYLSSLGIPLVQGRDFTQADMDASSPVLLVNRALGRELWPGENPVGKGLIFGKSSRLEVIGVVGDIHQDGLDVAPRPAMYVPVSRFGRSSFKIFVRSSGNPTALAAGIRSAIRTLEPNQPVSRIVPLTEVISDTAARPRLLTALVGTFASIALLLAALGIYGVIAHGVARRRHEIGIRMALGAGRADVRRLVVRDGMSLAAGGLGLGLAASLGLSPVLKSLLFQTPPFDPATLLVVAAVLAGVALLACAIPARRAARLDPQAALRFEA